MPTTRGQLELAAILRGPTLAEVARACGVSPAAVAHWLSGRSRPRRQHRDALEAFGIASTAWELEQHEKSKD